MIQFVRAKGSVLPSYHVIVYPEPKGLRSPLKLLSREQLLQRLSEAIPDFDENLLREGTGETQIIFAGTVKLTDGRIAKLFRS